MAHTIQPATDPGSKDSLPVSAIPAPPATTSGNFTLDNPVFSNVQKRFPIKPVRARQRRSVTLRLPGLLARPIRPRKFIRVLDATMTALRTSTVRETQTDGVTTLGGFTLVSSGADFVSNSVVVDDIVIISTGTSQGRYPVSAITDANTLQLRFKTPTAAAGATFHIIPANSFVDIADELCEIGALEIRNDSGTLQTLDGSPTGVIGVVPV